MLVNIVPRNYINFILKRGKQDGRIEKEDGSYIWFESSRTHAHTLTRLLVPVIPIHVER